MTKFVFNVKDAKELLAKFDKDDTGRLDRAELEEMKAALRAKRSDVEKEEEDVKKKMEAANKNSKKVCWEFWSLLYNRCCMCFQLTPTFFWLGRRWWNGRRYG